MNKECPSCRASIDETAVVCPFCGAMQPTGTSWENASWWNPAPMPGAVGGRTYPSSTAKGLSIALAVFCFISSASSLSLLSLLSTVGRMMEELGLMEEYAELLSMLSGELPVVLLFVVDAVFYLVFGILLLVKKSWKISLTITIYSAIWFLLGIIGNTPAGIPLTLVFGILATIWLRKDPMRGI